MSYTHAEQQVGPLTARVEWDEDGGYCDPRDNDNLGTMAFFAHATRNYDLGDERLGFDADAIRLACADCEGTGVMQNVVGVAMRVAGNRFAEIEPVALFDNEAQAEAFADDQERRRPDREYTIVDAVCPVCDGFGEVDATPERFFIEEREALFMEPIDMNDYGNGPRVRIVGYDYEESDGVIYATAADLLRFWGTWNGKTGQESRYSDPNETGEGTPIDWWSVIERNVPEILRAEVETYNAWLAGEVYVWSVEDEHGNVIDSCGGYVGEEEADYALQEAVASAQWTLDRREREASERRYWESRDVETV